MEKPEIDFVAVHDAVRPCLTESLIGAVFAKAQDGSGNWATSRPVSFTVANGKITQVEIITDRDRLKQLDLSLLEQ